MYTFTMHSLVEVTLILLTGCSLVFGEVAFYGEGGMYARLLCCMFC